MAGASLAPEVICKNVKCRKSISGRPLLSRIEAIENAAQVEQADANADAVMTTDVAVLDEEGAAMESEGSGGSEFQTQVDELPPALNALPSAESLLIAELRANVKALQDCVTSQKATIQHLEAKVAKLEAMVPKNDEPAPVSRMVPTPRAQRNDEPAPGPKQQAAVPRVPMPTMSTSIPNGATASYADKLRQNMGLMPTGRPDLLGP